MQKETLKNLGKTKEGMKLEMNKVLRNKSGITLIALVVTIVVLLILAGVSISLILDNNGIIQKSKDARRKYGQAKVNEQEQMDDVSDWIDETVTGKVPLAKIPVGTKANKNGTINGEEGDSNNPTIPKGYTPIDTETSTWGDGSSAPSQDSVNHGLVIKDDKDNEWVWIPVPDVTVMCDTSNNKEYTLCGTYGDKAVKTKLYSKSEIISGKTRNTPGTTTNPYYREPDIVDESGTSSDATNYKIIVGETGTKAQLAQLFVDEYKEMIESVSQYKGFYIGRYELSGTVTDPTEKSGTALIDVGWYNFYNACRNSKLQASNKVKTQMIWGCQWDVTMNWLISSGAKTNNQVNKDSRTWGNYWDSTAPANTGNYEQGELKDTGSNESWKANNIYDLAGNCKEWTQEAAYTSVRCERGGGCNSYGTGSGGSPASVCGSNTTLTAGFRMRYSSYVNNKIDYKQKSVQKSKNSFAHFLLCEVKFFYNFKALLQMNL